MSNLLTRLDKIYPEVRKIHCRERTGIILSRSEIDNVIKCWYDVYPEETTYILNTCLVSSANIGQLLSAMSAEEWPACGIDPQNKDDEWYIYIVNKFFTKHLIVYAGEV